MRVFVAALEPRRLLVHFICVFLMVVFFMVCADFNALFLHQCSSNFCNSRFILKRNVFATEVHCQITFFFFKIPFHRRKFPRFCYLNFKKFIYSIGIL